MPTAGSQLFTASSSQRLQVASGSNCVSASGQAMMWGGWSNATRIAATAYLYQHISVEAGKKFHDEAAGFAEIVLAAGLFALLLIYLKWLVRDYKVLGVGDLIQADVANRAPAKIAARPLSEP